MGSTTEEPWEAFNLPVNWEEGKDVAVACWNCGRKMKHNEHLARVFKNVTCEPCCDEHDFAVLQVPDEKVAEIDEIVPPLYRESDVDRLPFPDQVDPIISWAYKSGAKGLWINGDTRTGKTRSICLLVERLVSRGVDVRAFFHGSFPDELLEAIRSDRNFRRWKRELAAIPLVVIDDLFAEKMTERTEAALFELIDERIAYLRPTIITTQVVAKEAKDRFHSASRFEAFFARIKEFFELVSLGDQQAKLFPGGEPSSSTK